MHDIDTWSLLFLNDSHKTVWSFIDRAWEKKYKITTFEGRKQEKEIKNIFTHTPTMPT